MENFSMIIEIILKDEIYGDVVYNFRYLRENEMQQFADQHENGRVFAIHFTTYTTEGGKYIPWMKKQLISKGVRFIQRHINTVRDVSLDLPVLIYVNIPFKCYILYNVNVKMNNEFLQGKFMWEMKNFLYENNYWLDENFS